MKQPLLRKQYTILVLLVLSVSCTSYSPKSLQSSVSSLALNSGWQQHEITTKKFDFISYIPAQLGQTKALTVYIEGDGLAWKKRNIPSDNPTPINPVGFKLALKHPNKNAVYLARPCQYQSIGARNCLQKYWTSARFSEEVVAAMNEAINNLKQKTQASKIELVGFSGGGAIAILVAARRNDVTKIITVAGNLDHQAWTRIHKVSPLKESLNPINFWQGVANIPQVHFIGEKDKIMPELVSQSYVKFFPPQKNHLFIT